MSKVLCCLLMSVLLVGHFISPVVAQSNHVEITIEDATISFEVGVWEVQNDVDGYYLVLNSESGAFDFLFANQYLPEDQAVIAISDQTQFVEVSGLRPAPQNIEELNEALASSFSYALDQEPVPVDLGERAVWRMRVNFGVFYQYIYVVDIDGLTIIFHLFTTEEQDSLESERTIENLILSAEVSGDLSSLSGNTTDEPEYFAYQTSNDIWIVYPGTPGWIASQDREYHDIRLEMLNEDIGFLRLNFQTPDVLGTAVFGQGDADTILSTAKQYHPPYEQTIETTSAEEILVGVHSAFVKRFVYAEQSFDYYLFDFDGRQLLAIASYQNETLEANSVYVEDILQNLNRTDLLDVAVQFGVPTLTVTASTDAELDRATVAFTQFLPDASFSLNNSDYSHLFSIQMRAGIETNTYDLSSGEVTATYLIEVRLGEDKQLAYAAYNLNRAGILVWETDTYTVSGSAEFAGEFSGYIDPYTAAEIIEPGTPDIEVPATVSLSVEFTNIILEGREYLE